MSKNTGQWQEFEFVRAEQMLTDVDLLVTFIRDTFSEKLRKNENSSDVFLLEQQHCLHGLAWIGTYAMALREAVRHWQRLCQCNRQHSNDFYLTIIGVGEYLAQIFGGIAMNQGEVIRLRDFGFTKEQIEAFYTPAIDYFIEYGNTITNRRELARILLQCEDEIGQSNLDEVFEAIRDEIKKFVQSEIRPFAQDWHRHNAYIPMSIIEALSQLGVFGITIPEEYGGLGLGKVAMCVVSEELSRGYIGVGSLGTRSEIAAELILSAGTGEQKQEFLPVLARGELLPTAVFTEPDFGSDLASLETRAILVGDQYKITGNKTWITHPVRADLMTILVRTGAKGSGYRGLSILLAQKPRGSDDIPFPVAGLSGSEIEVIGYRGMKEFELAFDNFETPAKNLLGGVEGLGFKHLMQTFESARIQTAARAIGVARSAFDCGLRYAKERKQFGQALIQFPRIADKLVLMAVEIHIGRLLTYYAAHIKDTGGRCDLEAGMAKLLGARIAWACADNAVQIHGGNGFAQEYPISRILCDARILNIFEGAAEIQAQVIGKRLLEVT